MLDLENKQRQSSLEWNVNVTIPWSSSGRSFLRDMIKTDILYSRVFFNFLDTSCLTSQVPLFYNLTRNT